MPQLLLALNVYDDNNDYICNDNDDYHLQLLDFSGTIFWLNEVLKPVALLWRKKTRSCCFYLKPGVVYLQISFYYFYIWTSLFSFLLFFLTKKYKFNFGLRINTQQKVNYIYFTWLKYVSFVPTLKQTNAHIFNAQWDDLWNLNYFSELWLLKEMQICRNLELFQKNILRVLKFHHLQRLSVKSIVKSSIFILNVANFFNFDLTVQNFQLFCKISHSAGMMKPRKKSSSFL